LKKNYRDNRGTQRPVKVFDKDRKKWVVDEQRKERADHYAQPAEFYQREQRRIFRQERIRQRVRWGLLLFAVALTAGAMVLMSGRP